MKKIVSLLLSLTLVLSVLSMFGVSASAAENVWVIRDNSNITMSAGDSFLLKMDTASKQTDVTWKLSDTNVASISKYSSYVRVRCKKSGYCTITAKYKKETRTAYLTVNPKALEYKDFKFNGGTVRGYSNYMDLMVGESFSGFKIYENTNGTYCNISSWLSDVKSVNLGNSMVKMRMAQSTVMSNFKASESAILEVGTDDPYYKWSDSYYRPKKKMIVSCYSNNHYWYQSFYFDESSKVCLIVWSASAVN